jgi:hypothetical protein
MVNVTLILLVADMLKRFCFDVETRATTNQAVLKKIRAEEEDRPCPGKPTSANPMAKTIKRYQAAQEEWAEGTEKRILEKIDATAKDPLLAEPVCISAVCDGELVSWSVMHGQSENDMLIDFSRFIDENCGLETEFSGYCILIFDLPLIVTRCRLHHIQLPSFFPRYHRFWRGNVVDIQDLIPSRKPCLSFNDAAELHGINGKSLDWQGRPMNGSRVQDAIRAGEHDMIARYCDEDAKNEWELLNLCRPNVQGGGQAMRDQVKEVLESDLSDAMKLLTIKNLIGE